MARSAHLTSSALVTASKVLVEGVHVAGDGAAGSMEFRNGASDAAILVEVVVPANTSTYIPFGTGGVQFDDGLYVTVDGAGVTVFYRPAAGAI